MYFVLQHLNLALCLGKSIGLIGRRGGHYGGNCSGRGCSVQSCGIGRSQEAAETDSRNTGQQQLFIRYLLNIQSFLLHHEANLLLHRLRSGAESPHPPAEWSYYRKPGTLRLFANEVSIVAVIRH